MAIDWFDRSKKEGIHALIARKSYSKAIEAIEAALKKRRDNERLRVQLADVLLLAGRKKEAVERLTYLADDLALAGFAAKAIAILKRIRKIGPGLAEVEEKLAYLIRQQENPSPNPWRLSGPAGPPEVEIGMEGPEPEIGMEAMEPAEEPSPALPREAIPAVSAALPGRPPETPQPVPGPTETLQTPVAGPPPAVPPGPLAPGPRSPADRPAPAAAVLAETGPLFEAGLHDELVALVEETFKPVAAAEPAAAREPRPVVETPLFKDFSQQELVALICGLRLVTLEPGEIVMSAGEPGDSLFVLASGVVRAYTRTPEGRHVQVRLMTDGDFFGEISVLTGKRRTATITAATPCDLLELDRPTLDAIAGSHPRVREVLQEFYSQRAGQTGQSRA